VSDPFESSRRKIAWAKHRLADLKREVSAWVGDKNFYEMFTEPHPDKPQHVVHKMRVVKQVPDVCFNITGDIVGNLRAALDHAIYDIAVASGCNKPRNAYFPFSRDDSTFEANLKGRCADVPKDIYPLLRSFQPYKGGSEPLWALNEVRVANEHIPLTLMGSATFTAGVDVSAIGYWEMPYTPTLDRAKNEMELFTLTPGTKFKGKFQFGFYIAFGKIGSLEGKSVIPVLDLFVNMVETILREIETKCRELRII